MRAPATAVTEAVYKFTEILCEPPGGDGEMNRAGPADRAIGIEQPGQQCATLRLRGTQIPRGDVLITEHSEAAEDGPYGPMRLKASLTHSGSGGAAAKRPPSPHTGGSLSPVTGSERFAAERSTARYDLRHCGAELLAADQAGPGSRRGPCAGKPQGVLK